MSDSKKKPVEEIRNGRIKAAIWANSTENGTRYNVTFSRVYQKDGQWRNTGSFGRDDLLVVAKVANDAHSKVQELITADRKARNGAAEATDGEDKVKDAA